MLSGSGSQLSSSVLRERRGKAARDPMKTPPLFPIEEVRVWVQQTAPEKERREQEGEGAPAQQRMTLFFLLQPATNNDGKKLSGQMTR